MKLLVRACLLFLLSGASGLVLNGAEKANDVFSSAPGVVTIAELNTLKLPVRFPDTSVARSNELNEQLKSDPENESLKEKVASELEQREHAAKSSVGLFLPRTEFRLDEPAPVYFVLKNNTKESLHRDVRLDLPFGERCINSCEINLECIRTAEGQEYPLQIRQKLWRCGGAPLLTIPAKGYYCTSGDLRTLGATVPGEYRLHWVGNGCRSQDVTFTMLPAKEKSFRYQPVTAARIFKINDTTDSSAALTGDAKKLVDPPLPPVVDPAHLTWLRFETHSAGLATGLDGRFYPDILSLPSHDDQIGVTARFEASAEGTVPSELVLTLIPRQAQKGLVIRGTSNIYLIVRSRQRDLDAEKEFRPREAAERLRPMEIGHSLADPTKPLPIRIHLNEGWHENVRLAGKVEVSVVISTAEIESQGHWPRLGSLESEVVYADKSVEWKGLLCTKPISLRLPEMGDPEE